MESQEIYNKVERQFPGKVSGFRGDVFDPSFIVGAESIVDVCRYLRDDPETAFERRTTNTEPTRSPSISAIQPRSC